LTILTYELFMAVMFGIAVGVFVFFNVDRVLDILYARSLGSRQDVIALMDKLYLDLDKERVTMMILVGSTALGLLVFLLLWPRVLSGIILGGAVTLVGWTMPRTVLVTMWEARCNKVVDQMVDGMTILANGVKSGKTVAQSMEKIVVNMKGPLPQEFNVVLNKIRLGMALEEALNEFGERIPRKDVQMFVAAVNILKETGGNLAETFETINSTIRERQKIEKKIDALTTQGVWQARIISAIPFLLMAVFFVVDPQLILPLFTTTLGWGILFIMFVLIGIGGFLMKKIVTIKV
jgi:tight adherence protein B